jgi:hypothetical protein
LTEEEQLAVFRVKLSLLAGEKGGRQSAITQNYRPHHRTIGETGNYYFMGDFLLRGADNLSPGESCTATVRCIMTSRQLSRLLKDKSWEIVEGGHLVGHVKILERLTE